MRAALRPSEHALHCELLSAAVPTPYALEDLAVASFADRAQELMTAVKKVGATTEQRLK